MSGKWMRHVGDGRQNQTNILKSILQLKWFYLKFNSQIFHLRNLSAIFYSHNPALIGSNPASIFAPCYAICSPSENSDRQHHHHRQIHHVEELHGFAAASFHWFRFWDSGWSVDLSNWITSDCETFSLVLLYEKQLSNSRNHRSINFLSGFIRWKVTTISRTRTQFHKQAPKNLSKKSNSRQPHPSASWVASDYSLKGHNHLAHARIIPSASTNKHQKLLQAIHKFNLNRWIVTARIFSKFKIFWFKPQNDWRSIPTTHHSRPTCNKTQSSLIGGNRSESVTKTRKRLVYIESKGKNCWLGLRRAASQQRHNKKQLR